MRKILFQSSICLFLFMISCQNQSHITIKQDDFQFTIQIPNNFKKVSGENWENTKSDGKETYEMAFNKSATESDAENTLFAYKYGRFHTLESNYKVIDTTADYVKTIKGLNAVTFETLKRAIPNAELDSLSSKQIISGLEFDTFQIEIIYSNGEKLTTKSFRRLFNNKRVSLNILYKDKSIGADLINSILTSKFN